MSEALTLVDNPDFETGPMSPDELTAVLANGSVGSQIRCTQTNLEMAYELPPNKRGPLVAELSAQILRLEEEYDNPDSPTWKRYADRSTTPVEPATMRNVDLLTALKCMGQASSGLNGKTLKELYALSDTITPVLEDTLQAVLDAIIAAEENEPNIIPSPLAVDIESAKQYAYVSPHDMQAEEAKTVAMAQIPPLEYEATIVCELEQVPDSIALEPVLLIAADFVDKVKDYLSPGPATYSDIMQAVLGVVRPEVSQTSTLLTILNRLVADGTLVRDTTGSRNQPFALPSYEANKRFKSTHNTLPHSSAKKVSKKTVAGGRW